MSDLNQNDYVTEGLAEYVETLFPENYAGVCIDVGAYDPFWISNSWLFESKGWDTYCIEPNPSCIPRLKQHRKNVLQYACGDNNEDNVELFVYKNDIVGEAAGTGLIKHIDTGETTYLSHSVKISVKTLDWLLKNKIKKTEIDFLSIDVEHYEMFVLKGLDFTRYRPKVIAIENLEKEQEQIDFLVSKGYRLVYRIYFNDIYMSDEFYDDFLARQAARPKGLFINSSKANCSIHESGVMIFTALTYSHKYTIDYIEINREEAQTTEISKEYDFYVINWHHWSLPIPRKTIERLPGQKFSIVLEVDINNIFPYSHSDWFDAYLIVDPTKTKYSNVYPFPRPLELIGELPGLLSEKIPVLGSFGLLTGGKDFGDLVRYANDIGESIVRINLPPVTYMGDIGVCIRLTDYANKLKRLAKSYVDIRVTHNYLEKPELVRWLAQNTINVFPYYRNQPGLAAVTDQAISANRPIAVTECNTFRHMHPYISYYPKYSITELIENSMDGVKKMQEDWHPFRFKDRFEELLKQQGIL